VLTDAACEGKTDHLLDFKSNIIMGHPIPGGTGFEEYRKRVIKSVDREGDEELQFVFSD
jgi:DNA-directed RNA polymerase subunit beta'